MEPFGRLALPARRGVRPPGREEAKEGHRGVTALRERAEVIVPA
jgi:hypothetical protein